MDELTSWLEGNVRPGLILPVHHGHGGLEWFQLGEVTGVNREQRKLYIKHNGVFFFSGKNCTDPKGAVYVVMPTPEVIKAACEGIQMINGDPKYAPRRELSQYERELSERNRG